MTTPVIRVGVIGAGYVGSALVGLLLDDSRHDALVDAATATLEVVAVAVRDLDKPHPGVPASLLTTDAAGLAATGDIDILVELAGGLEPTRSYIESALCRGVSVVTANKALMAERGTALARLGHEHGADLFYEAAVGGAVPILRALRTSLAGERIERVMGIVNGTTNFILSQMTAEGLDYETALAQAKARGYAEADPTADVEGFDAASKVLILASLAFGTELRDERISRQGISGIRAVDIEFARRAGYVIKLLGVAERVGEHGLSRRVHPAMVPVDHPLAAVHGPMNAVFVEGAVSGPLMWLGEGAGGLPSACPPATSRASSISPSTWPTNRACSPVWRASLARIGSRSGRWSSSGSAPRRDSPSSPTTRSRATWRRRSRNWRRSTRSTRSGRVYE